ncbi:MAG TPA: flagellar filament capping protein FliD [bacterium]|nr:flagellar filament capping protein FliD [bacterium]HQP99097.1 flagellar filament capping protein FliD [bacterium]
MSSLGIDGLVSGFDTSAIIEAILNAQVRAPVSNLEDRITTYTERLTAFQTLSASLLGVRTAAEALSNASLFQGKQATSSNTSLVSVTASRSAELGGFSMQVYNLAKADQISTDYFSSATESLNLDGEFILNGKRIHVSSSDSLQTIASQINSANAGVKASTIETAAGQIKMVLSAASNGVGQLELREVGSSGILNSLTLIDDPAPVSYDYTVNANARGAVSKTFANLTDVAGVSGNFTIRDAGGQYEITLDGANSISATDTVQDIIDKINAAATGTNISAHAVQDGSDWRIEIRSTTGIPTQFDDPDSVLQGLEIVDGIQSEDFSSTSTSLGTLLGLSTSPSGSFDIQGGDAINFTVNVDFSTDSLQDIVTAINDAAGLAGSDVTAEIMTVGTESRISIKSATGNPTFSNDAQNLLSTLGIVDYGFKNIDQAGENAQFTYNGTLVNRTDNLITDLVDGVSLALISESATDFATIGITQNTSGISEAVQDFVTAYNSARAQIDQLTFFDTSTGEKGILLGDSAVRTAETLLSSLIGTRVPKLPGTELSELNNGDGIKLGSIRITDRTGASGEVDLSTAKTIEDVLYLINYSGLNVKAEVNSSGTGLNIIDESDGLAGPLKVEDIGSGTTALDLGIRGHLYSNTIAGTQIYEGGTLTANEFGLELTAEGMLSFDSDTFTSALNENLDEIKNLFSASDVGIGGQFVKQMSFLTDSTSGLITMRSQGITNSIEQFQDSIKRYNERAEKMEETLRKKYTALETAMAESQQLMTYLTQQAGTAAS